MPSFQRASVSHQLLVSNIDRIKSVSLELLPRGQCFAYVDFLDRSLSGHLGVFDRVVFTSYARGRDYFRDLGYSGPIMI